MNVIAQPTTRRRQVGHADLLALAIGYGVSFASLTALPIWIGAIAEQYRLTLVQSGLVVFCEFGAFALASLAVAALPAKASRTTMMLALAAIVAGNVAAAVPTMTVVFVLTRMIAGAASGYLGGQVMRFAARRPDAARAFAAQQFAVVIFALGFFLTAPMLLARVGFSAPFLFMAAFSFLAMPLMWWLRDGEDAPSIAAPNAGRGRTRLQLALAVLAILLAFATQGGLWSYATAAGQRCGLSLAHVSTVFAAGALINPLAPIAAARFADRWGPFPPMAAGFALLALSAWGIAAQTDRIPFIAGAAVLNLALLFLAPMLFATLARLDPTGRVAALAPACLMAGTAGGSAIGGFIIGAAGFATLGWVGVATATSGLAAIGLALRLGSARFPQAARTTA